MIRRCLLVIAVIAAATWAQSDPSARSARAWRETHERAILSEYLQLLASPNLSRDSAGVRKNAAMVAALFEKRGVKTQLLEVAGAPPVVYGELRAPGATRTIVFYAHYDGQPLDPKEWATPPWEPVLRDRPLERDGRVITLPQNGKIDPEWRIYARSASDDKAPIEAMATALDSLKDARTPLRSNLKFFIEGEEEAGSPHLEEILTKYKSLLAADLWLVCDGPVHQSRRPQIVFGARGITNVEVAIYGPSRELHSGHYGNWAPNPAMALARLLATMKDDDGRVLIENFYDDVEPLSDTEKRAVAEAPEVERELMRELALGRTDGAGKTLVDLLNSPSLNVRGMGAARSGDTASNVIPSVAIADIDMRLVKGITPAMAYRRLLAHIRKQGYEIVETEPDAATRMQHPKLARVTWVERGYPASRTPMDLPVSQMVLRTAEAAMGPAVKLPTMGGSVPLYLMDEILHTPAITIPIANHDNNQHSFNENLRVQNLWDGIELLAALMAM